MNSFYLTDDAQDAFDGYREAIESSARALSFDGWDKPQRYQYRKTRYEPGSVLLIPTHPSFGGTEGVFAVGLVHSCNWLGLIQLYLTDRWVGADDDIGDVAPDDVIEGWYTGDALLLADVIETRGTQSIDRDDWPANIGREPPYVEPGLWESWLKPRRLKPVQAEYVASERRVVNLFVGMPVWAVIVRASERLAGKPIDPWPIPGASPDIQGFRIPQRW